MSHYGILPSAVCDAIILGLSIFKLQTVGGVRSGCVPTIRRFAGEKPDVDLIDRELVAGLPAMLVAYTGGQFEGIATSQDMWLQVVPISIICCAGRFESMAARLSGGADAATNPGVEDLLDWATYHGYRAMRTAGLTRVKPIRHRLISIEPGKVVAAAELEGSRCFDFYDEEPTATLQSAGLVHDPLDPEQLFLEDNVTPNQAEPLVGGGVSDLED